MTEVLGVPLHAALVHFPIAASVFGLAGLATALLLPASRRRPWLAGAALLLLAAALTGGAASVTGRGWAESSGLIPGGGWIPARELEGGLPFRHALLGLATTGASLVSAVAAFRAFRSGRGAVLAFLLALATASLALSAGHAGGLLVHAPEPSRAGQLSGPRDAS